MLGVEHRVADQSRHMVVLHPVEHLRALSAGAHESGHPQLGQMLRHRRCGLPYQGRELVDRQFLVQHRPEQTHTGGVGEHAEHLGREFRLLPWQPWFMRIICMHTQIIGYWDGEGLIVVSQGTPSDHIHNRWERPQARDPTSDGFEPQRPTGPSLGGSAFQMMALGIRTVKIEPWPGPRCGGDSAAVGFDESLGDTEPNPGAALVSVASGVDPVEAVEDMVQVFGVDSLAGVGNGELDPGVDGADRRA